VLAFPGRVSDGINRSDYPQISTAAARGQRFGGRGDRIAVTNHIPPAVKERTPTEAGR
jgi:hypothetical protein